VAYFYVGGMRDQQFLLPVSMRDWLDEGHLAWFVIDVVERIDTSALHARHPNDGVGRPAYDPDMMLALIFYAYAGGVRSSRRIEASCTTDAAYRVICGDVVPDHATIARFLVDHQDAITQIFVQGCWSCPTAPRPWSLPSGPILSRPPTRPGRQRWALWPICSGWRSQHPGGHLSNPRPPTLPSRNNDPRRLCRRPWSSRIMVMNALGSWNPRAALHCRPITALLKGRSCGLGEGSSRLSPEDRHRVWRLRLLTPAVCMCASPRAGRLSRSQLPLGAVRVEDGDRRQLALDIEVVPVEIGLGT
jgi:transposase